MSMPRFSLAGQRALVTGGRRGIGRSIALAFAEAGADVVINENTGKALAQIVDKAKGKAKIQQLINKT